MLILTFELSGPNLPGVISWFLVFVWFISLVMTVISLRRQKPIPASTDQNLCGNDGPLVSVLVPARNEEHRILVDSVRSILTQDYGRFEVIAVNDRSTDSTGDILRSLALSDDRLQVFEGGDLPNGWLGKPYAMHQALGHARGDWILATDADMIFEQTALRTAVATVIAQKADALTLIPYFEAVSFWERIMIPTWAWVMSIFIIALRIDNPKTEGALALGGFFLIRRSTLLHVGGYEVLKDEVMEDVRLGELIKRSGSKLVTEYAPNLLRTRMYRNFGEMWESCTKTWFSGMKFSLPFALLCVAWMYFIAISPCLIVLIWLIAISTGANLDSWSFLIPAALSWLLQAVVLMFMSVRSGVSPIYSLTTPLGLVLLYTMLLDSSIRIVSGKGVTWKGRKIYERTGVTPPDPSALAARIPRIED